MNKAYQVDAMQETATNEQYSVRVGGYAVSTNYLLTFTYNATTQTHEMYVDGLAVALPNAVVSGSYTAMGNKTGDALLGKSQRNTAQSLNRYLGEFVIYNKELSASEVSDLWDRYNAGLNFTD